jgi:basic membrane lipoprotein Med (substrate-binding protein (PBP1-ABC) superfamily)
LLLLAALAAALMLGACGADSESSGTKDQAATAGSSDTKKLKVAMPYVGPLEQQWNSRIHKAIKAEADAGNIEYQFTENVDAADVPRLMEQYAADGYDLVMGTSFADEEGTREMASRHPETQFLVGSSGAPAGPNYSVFDNHNQDASYLCGMVVGGVTKTNKIGMVGGFPVPEVNRLANAFMAGAREVNPDVKILTSFINSWFDPPKTKEAAFAQMDAGADIIYAERTEAVTAVEERKKLAAAEVVDVGEQHPDSVLCSAIWHFEPTFQKALETLKSDGVHAEDYAEWSYMKNKGAELSSFHGTAGRIPDDVEKKVEERKAEILSGAFKVPDNIEKPK